MLRDDFTITLTDDEELPTLKLSAVPDMVGEGGGGQRLTVTASLEDGVVLPTATTVAVEVEENADQYSRSTAMLSIVIPANQRSGTGSVTITPVPDVIFDENLSIELKGTATLVEGMDGTKQTAMTTVTLIDDDHTVTLSVSPASIPEIGGDHDVTVTATKVREAVQDEMIEVMVPAFDVGGSDGMRTSSNGITYTLSSGTPNVLEDGNVLSIPIKAGEKSGEITLTVTPTHNTDFTGPATIPLTGSAARGAEITIRDNEQVMVTLDVDPAAVPEAGGSEDVTVTATLSGRLVNDLAISLSLSGDADVDDDYSVSGLMEITVPSGATTESTTLTINPVDDLEYEGNETISVTGRTERGKPGRNGRNHAVRQQRGATGFCNGGSRNYRRGRRSGRRDHNRYVERNERRGYHHRVVQGRYSHTG